MRGTGHRLLSCLLSLVLLAALAEQALGHHHAFSEQDLAAHLLVEVQPGAHAATAHLDHALEARHEACPACALSATPSVQPLALVALALPVELGARRLLAGEPSPIARGPRDAPARAPPSLLLSLV